MVSRAHGAALGDEPIAVSFENDIRPLFRDSPDVDSMKDMGLTSRRTKRSKRKPKQSMRGSKTAACRVMSLGPKNALPCSSAGWKKAWPLSVTQEESSQYPVGEQGLEVNMRFKDFSFGSIRIDGVTYEYDVVIDRGRIGKRKKKASKKFRDEFGHTPLSIEEDIPWKCRRLVVGTGAHGSLPVMNDIKLEAERRKIELVILPTAEAIKALEENAGQTNAILHVTC
jgi:hypothetical protein